MVLCYFLHPLPAYNSPAPATPTTTENHRHQFQHFSFPNFSLSLPPPLSLEHIPLNPHRLDAPRIIRLGAVHPIAVQPNNCAFRWRRPADAEMCAPLLDAALSRNFATLDERPIDSLSEADGAGSYLGFTWKRI